MHEDNNFFSRKVNLRFGFTVRGLIELILFFVAICFIIYFYLINLKLNKYKNEVNSACQLEGITNIENRYMKVTYYSSEECCKNKNSKMYGFTFSGRKAKVGVTISVDPSIIPIGSILIDRNGNLYSAEDTGSRIKGDHVDIFVGNSYDKKKLNESHYENFIIIQNGNGRY